MATTNYTTLLGLALPTTGDLSGTWGTEVNNAITSLLDTAVAGTTTLSADTDVTLSTTNGAANQARSAVILWTATGSTTRNITAPAQSKAYVVINATGGSQSIVIRGAGPTTGVTIPAGNRALVAWNGSDFVTVSSTFFASPLAVTGNSTAGAEIRLPEDTDNGSNYVALKAADTLAGNVTFTLPNADGTNGQVLQTDGSGVLSFVSGASLATPLAVVGNATAGAEIRLPEDTDNGSNYVALKAADTLAGNVTFTLPNADGTNGQVIQTNGGGVLSFVSGASLATPLAVVGNATAGAELRLPEDTDNGSNYVALKAADTLAGNVTFTLPNADGTNGQVLQTNGSGVLSFVSGASLATPLAVVGNATAGAEIRLPEDTDNGSNYVALKAPNTLASDLTFTLPSADGTNGQVLKTNGSGVLSFVTAGGGFTLATPVATTSGTSIDFTSIPAGTKQIIISFKGVSTSGTDPKFIQIGDSGGIETSGYSSTSAAINETGAVTAQSNLNAFLIKSVVAAQGLNGSVTLTLENSSAFSWAASGNLENSGGTSFIFFVAGSKSLSAELDRVRITTLNGTDTFDAGEINIAYI